jgi:hypothetical protein
VARARGSGQSARGGGGFVGYELNVSGVASHEAAAGQLGVAVGDGCGFKVSVVVTRENVSQRAAFRALTDRYGAQLRIAGCVRPAAAPTWDALHPTLAQQRELYS